MTLPRNADLHCHSDVSDGTMTPASLVRRAVAHGVDLLALTDHDNLGGLAEAAAQADASGLTFVPGVEVSVTWAEETVHVVGLGIDPTNPALDAALSGVRAGRIERARSISAGVESALGISGLFDSAIAHATHPEMASRSHIARALVERGVCRTTSEVFDRFMIAGRPGHVPHRWATLEQAVGWIRGAGGVAVLAHPGRYRIGDLALGELIGRFQELGGEAIEVVSGCHDNGQVDAFARRARALGLRASRGSDFHGPGEGAMDIGHAPALPAGLVPVWADGFITARATRAGAAGRVPAPR